MEEIDSEYLILTIALWFGFYAIVVLSLNIEYGYGGIPNFGRALAVLMGGVAVGGLINRILINIFNVTDGIIEASGTVKSIINSIIVKNPILGIIILLSSLGLAAILGWIVGALFILPSARLSEDYLAITLLAISEVTYLVLYYNVDIIGGYYGVSIPDVLAFIPGTKRIFVFTGILILIVFGCYIFIEKLLNSPYGRVLKAMRENELVAKAYGKNVMMLRVKTVALGSSIASLAGALYSFYSVNVITTSFSRVEWTFYPILMLILGGAGNNVGALLGAFTFVLTKVLLITYKFEITSILHLPFQAVWLEYILFGVVMLLILLFKPEGLIKEKPVFTKAVKKVVKTKQKQK
ncbi:MAG: branched-chain amino acid ABC transporter permease [Candidatus Bathyarchaeia archaeon]|nr:branched-chain amino acid ABC transporter permease [Candidatus Bathyarchaeota archaeon]